MSDDEYDFDPWETTDERPVKTEVVAERTWPASLYHRAEKRVGDISRVDGRTWRIAGRKQLGDTYDGYTVIWRGGQVYECECQDLTYGDTRIRRGCSHILAVMIQRATDGHQTDGHQTDGHQTDGHSSDGGDGALGALGSDSDRPPVQGTGRQLELVVPSISDPRLLRDEPPLPDKFEALRPGQWEAVEEVLEAYRAGAGVVWLDAPTGTGKSLVAELVRRMLHARAFYVCHSKTLQQQFLSDFDYAQVLMGRGNYQTLDRMNGVTCEDCTKSNPMDECMWCYDAKRCPYQVAKRRASAARISVLNMAYLLTEANYIGQVTANRDLGIVDECDLLEEELMGFVEFYLSDRLLNRLRVAPPKEGSHRTTLARWIVDVLEPRVKSELKSVRGDELADIRDRHRFERLASNVGRMVEQIKKDEGLETWVRDNRAGPLVLKPVTVSAWGGEYLWAHARRWLCMSATVISADELSTSTGLGAKWEVVRVPMGFPVDNRRIIVAPVADMSRRGKEAGEWETAITALRRVCDRHPFERILVHTVSYDLARLAHDGLRNKAGRPVLTYRRAADRDNVLSRFRRTANAVLVAPSMDRGVDLADDDCRVVVVLKIPFPYLGDRQISERMRMPDGDAWYATQTVRTLVQMTGRAVRSDSDWCVSYILDRQMVKDSRGKGGILKRHRSLLPVWWRDALVLDFPVRELVEERG